MNTKILLLGLLGLGSTCYGAVTITTPTVNTGELIRAGDWNKIRADLVSLSSTLDILGNQAWQSSGSDMYYLNGRVGAGIALPPAQLSVYKPTPSANEAMFQIGQDADDNKFKIDEDGDTQMDGTLLVRGGTVYDSSGSLELNGEDNVYVSMDWNDNDNDNRAFIIGKNDAGPGDDWVELVRVTETGRVGIGTTSPAEALEVVGSIKGNSRVEVNSHMVSGVGSGGVAMTINDGYGNANLTFNHTSGTPEQNGNSGRVEVNTDSTGTATMDFELKNNVVGGTPVDLNNIMRLRSDGRVGIGTTSPTVQLSVAGSININNSHSFQVGGIGDTYVGELGNSSGVLSLTADTNRNVQIGDANTPSALFVKNDGNIGIGTTNPTKKLHIVGGDVKMSTNQVFEFDNYSNGGTTSIRGISGGGAGNALVLTSRAGIHFIMDSNADAAASEFSFGKRTTGGMNGNWGGGFEEQMVIKGGGNVGIGTSDPDFNFHVKGDRSGYIAKFENRGGVGSDGIQIHIGDGSPGTDSHYIRFYDRQGDTHGHIRGATNGLTYNSTSDERLKKNISATQYGLDDLMDIQVRDYGFYEGDENERQTGFVAQELYEVLPQTVTVGGVNPKEDPWTVAYARLTPFIVKAVQDLKAEKDSEIEVLKQQNEALRARIEVLENQ